MSTSTPSVRVPLARIAADASTQARATLFDEPTVSDYREHLDDLPPVEVYDDGERLHVGDGNNRVEAHRRQGRTDIAAIVHRGTARDALLHSIRANHAHGLNRSRADKRRAVELLLADPEWRERWSDRELAREAGVSHTFVANVRRELEGPSAGNVATFSQSETFGLMVALVVSGHADPEADRPMIEVAWSEERAAMEAGESWDLATFLTSERAGEWGKNLAEVLRRCDLAAAA